MTETPLYVVHVMSKDAMDEIRLGHEAGQKLFGEVVSGALALTDEPWWVLSPECCALHDCCAALVSLGCIPFTRSGALQVIY